MSDSNWSYDVHALQLHAADARADILGLKDQLKGLGDSDNARVQELIAANSRINLAEMRLANLEAIKPVEATLEEAAPAGAKSIEDFGCKSMWDAPGFDNAPILNSLFQRLGRDVWHPIFVPGKQYRIDDTLKLPARCGVVLQGVGGMSLYTNVWEFKDELRGGPVSTLVWHGPPGRPMIEYSGYGGVIDSLTLFGRPKPGVNKPHTHERAAVGLWVTDNRNSIGTGKLHIPTICISECDAGIRVGPWDVGGTGRNADNIAVGYYQAIGCGAAYQITGEDAVNHHIYGLFRPYYCDIGIDAQRGGKVQVTDTDFCSPGILLRITKPMATTATFRFGRVTVDNNILQKPESRIVKSDANVTQIVMENVHFPHVAIPSPLFEIAGGTRLSLNHAYELRKALVKGTSQQVTWSGQKVWQIPLVSLRDCRLDSKWAAAKDIYTSDSSTNVQAFASGCTDFHNALLAIT